MKKLTKQIAALTGAAAVFALFDLCIWQLGTKRCINDTSAEMQAKSVEISRYLPFDDHSEIIRTDSELTLTGDLPVIDGAAGLFPVYSAFVNAVYPPDSVQFDGEAFLPESAMQYTNTRGAYKAVAEGTADIVICVKPSAEQLAYAEQQGADLELVPLGYDAFVFLVHADNPVDSLTSEQLRGIYDGTYTNWSQVGGKHLPIDNLQRNPGSGSQSAMEAFMGDIPMKRNPFGFLGSSIGFSFRFYVTDIVQNGGVKMLALDGVYPDAEHIADGSYPIVSAMYAVYDKHNTNENLPVLLEWMQSDEAQKIIADTGFIPLNGAV